MRVIHRALESWHRIAKITAAVEGWGNAIVGDTLEDKLLQREFAEGIRRLNVLGSVHILDAMKSHRILRRNSARPSGYPRHPWLSSELSA